LRVSEHNFKSEQEALNFFYSRRLDYLRFYELSSEPYFGTPDEVDCKNNINIEGKISDSDDKKFYFLKMIEDEKENFTDCLFVEGRRALYLGSIQCRQKVFIVKGIDQIDLGQLKDLCR